VATIGDFLKKLSSDADLLVRYYEDPRAVLANESELEPDDQENLLSDEPAEVLKALREEFPGETFFKEQWKPIRFPLPIPRPRPIRRVGA
jgi:hypothetical protein